MEERGEVSDLEVLCSKSSTECEGCYQAQVSQDHHILPLAKTGIKTSNICSQRFAGACSTYLKIRKRSFDIDNIDNGSGALEGGERVAASSAPTTGHRISTLYMYTGL